MILGQRQLQSKIFPYVITKLSGAGFSLSIFFSWMLLMSDFDMYKFVREISKWSYWIIFFGYGMVCSIGIDLLTSRMKRMKLTLIILLYILAGYALFFLKDINAITIFAGTIGALFSLLFYFGTYVSRRKSQLKYAFAIALPLFFIILANYDFSEKIHWDEVRTDSTYTASFEYFNGQHEIPIRAKKGQTIAFTVDVTNGNGGGHGFHVLNEKNKMVGMMEENGDKMKVIAQNTEIYRIVLTGDDLKGSIQVAWTIDD